MPIYTRSVKIYDNAAVHCPGLPGLANWSVRLIDLRPLLSIPWLGPCAFLVRAALRRLTGNRPLPTGAPLMIVHGEQKRLFISPVSVGHEPADGPLTNRPRHKKNLQG